mgnify:FL=1|jgi:hypothetical protein
MLDSLKERRGTGSVLSRLESGVREFVGLGALGVNSLTLGFRVSILLDSLDFSKCSVLRLMRRLVRCLG